MRLKLFVLLFLLVILSPHVSQADSPLEMTQRLITSIQACKGEDPSIAQNHTCNTRKIEENLAIAELAEWLLGPHWQTMGEEQRQSFTALLASLLREIAYPMAAKFLADTQIEYGQDQVNGDDAVVITSVVDPDEGQVSINYRLHQIEGEWRVWDVQLDGVSMAGNLRKQVQSVIAKKSYEELVRRMRQKLEENRAG